MLKTVSRFNIEMRLKFKASGKTTELIKLLKGYIDKGETFAYFGKNKHECDLIIKSITGTTYEEKVERDRINDMIEREEKDLEKEQDIIDHGIYPTESESISHVCHFKPMRDFPMHKIPADHIIVEDLILGDGKFIELFSRLLCKHPDQHIVIISSINDIFSLHDRITNYKTALNQSDTIIKRHDNSLGKMKIINSALIAAITEKDRRIAFINTVNDQYSSSLFEMFNNNVDLLQKNQSLMKCLRRRGNWNFFKRLFKKGKIYDI